MGNHSAGTAMGLAAERALEQRQPGETALALLDKVCGPHKNCDAEFEAQDPRRPGYVHPVIRNYTDPHPQAALGTLLVEAFAPNGLEDLSRYAPCALMHDGTEDGVKAEEVAFELWVNEVYEKFRARYNFY